MEIVKYGSRNNELAQLEALSRELSNATGGMDFAEFVQGAAPDQVAFMKQFLNAIRRAQNGGEKLVGVPWKATIAVSNISDDTNQEFYICPGMLAGVGDAGVAKDLNVPFNGIGRTDLKLKATVLTVLPAVFYRWIYQYPTYSKKITVAGSNSDSIQSGYIKHATINPESDSGVNAFSTLLLANYNISESYQATKAEIYDQVLLLSEQNVLKANVLFGQNINVSMDLMSYVPAVYAEMFNKQTTI